MYDPLVVRRKLIKSGYDAAVKARDFEKIVACGREAFGLEPIQPDGKGVLEATVYDCVVAFTHYLAGKGSRVN